MPQNISARKNAKDLNAMKTPNPDYCCVAVWDNTTRFPKVRQCGRRPTIDIGGYIVCTGHATIARTKGKIDIIDTQDRRDSKSSGLDYTTVQIEKDEQLAQSKYEREREKERYERANYAPFQVDKLKKIIAFYEQEFLSGTSITAHLLATHPDDIDKEIAAIKDSGGKDTPGMDADFI